MAIQKIEDVINKQFDMELRYKEKEIATIDQVSHVCFAMPLVYMVNAADCYWTVSIKIRILSALMCVSTCSENE